MHRATASLLYWIWVCRIYIFCCFPDITSTTESDVKYTVIGLNLLYLLVENRLSDFHSEVIWTRILRFLLIFNQLELYADTVMHHPYIAFCTQLEQHLMVGSYDQVMEAAKHPPVECYSFFLNSLLETVRVNIADCAVASYRTLTMQAAKKILMFSTLDEARDFMEDKYPELLVVNDVIDLRSQKTCKSEEIPSMKLISQTLAYAAELERIV